MNLFFSTEIDKNLITLSEDESKHVMRVLRSEQGDIIFVTNGEGKLFKTKISKNKSKHCICEILEEMPPPPKPGYHLHLAIAPTKNHNRMEWFVEKATEIGISEITPVICHNSERKSIQADRLERLLISAMKQSGRLILPRLNTAATFGNFVEAKFGSDKFIASCMNEEKKSLKHIYKPGNNALILIGPEGDFNDEEIIKAKVNGFIPVSLGANRYRTETAALMACHTIALMNEVK
ncbi:MAG: 16S rRNA (uracil(1498)-N(3))-methyltransferase [Bacteroidota bacterium]